MYWTQLLGYWSNDTNYMLRMILDQLVSSTNGQPWSLIMRIIAIYYSLSAIPCRDSNSGLSTPNKSRADALDRSAMIAAWRIILLSNLKFIFWGSTVVPGAVVGIHCPNQCVRAGKVNTAVCGQKKNNEHILPLFKLHCFVHNNSV